MRLAVAIAALGVIGIVLWDAFESVVLPRRVTRQYRLTSFFFKATWPPFRALSARIEHPRRREAFLAFYGPFAMIALLVLWASALVTAFAALHWSISPRGVEAGRMASFLENLYMSGTTFFTLGLGDVLPKNGWGRALMVVECATGFGFLAVVIGYLPVLFQSFSRREVNVSLLDPRAGSPPSAPELLRRSMGPEGPDSLAGILHDWEFWSADLLESHLSYPVLCYYRSQHANQSWIAAITTILDASALSIVAVEGASIRQARLTFTMARHAVIDLSQIFALDPEAPPERLPAGELAALLDGLEASGVPICRGCAEEEKLRELRSMYEPYVFALATYLAMPLPGFAFAKAAGSWKKTEWRARAERKGQ